MSTKNSVKHPTNKKVDSKAAELTEKIAELNQEVIVLRETVFKQREEIHAMRNSRVLGRIIKVHDTVGNPYTLVPRAIHKTRRTVAKFVPDSIRLPMMRGLRKVRDTSKQKVNEYRYKSIEVIEVKNSALGKGIPLVSVIVPYYNRADTIDETLESLEKQTLAHFELIIVNDGSTDGDSVKKLKEIGEKHPRVDIVHQKNQGVAAARNNGISKAKGKYIVCLDSDDILEPTFLEKAATVLETNPEVQITSSYMTIFGVKTEEFRHSDFDPLKLYKDNMIITAAMFTKEAWHASGGYKSGIGYEDWEYWISLVEKGYMVYQIPENLFRYRTSMQSRYIEDKDVHWDNLKKIRSLHPQYEKKVKALQKERHMIRRVLDQSTALINLNEKTRPVASSKSNVLITIPWMTFGGAETLIYNFCREIKDDYAITFVTGLKSEHEWQYKFEEISKDIFHLANLFQNEDHYMEYISRLITVRSIDTLHIIHNGFTFDMLATLKARHPQLRVIVTLFNDRAAYFEQSLRVSQYIDTFTSDNQSVTDRFKREALIASEDVRCIPNGINSVSEFNPTLQPRELVRDELGLSKDDVAVFFVGRLSEEKNPDVFLKAASEVVKANDTKQVHFFMIGDGGMRKEIEEMIKTIDDKKVIYLGYQSEVAYFLSAADVFVLPSSIEGFPLSILEAMAMRVVVVASNVGAVSQVVENEVDGFVIEPGSVKEIVSAVKLLNKDRKKLEAMKQLSRNKVEKLYSNVVLGRNYEKLYGERTK